MGRRTIVHQWVVASILIAVLLCPRAHAQNARDDSSPPEVIQIDGAKNPELIPQWSAWGYAFRVIAGGPRELPSTVHHVASSEEKAMVLREADAVQRIDKTCQDRVLKLHPLVGREDPAVVDAKLRAITLECRHETLHARDRVLKALNPEAATALILFVESTKSGTTMSIRKRDLARFLEPE
jgi:hypothetical protein